MGISFTTFQDRAKQNYPGVDIDFPDGRTLRLQPVFELDDDQLTLFSEAQTKLAESDENGRDLRELKYRFVDFLSVVSNDPPLARSVFSGESLGTLTEIFKEYSDSVGGDEPKSEEATGAAS